MKKDFNDGVCENCGNVGLAGEKCLLCGGTLATIESDDSTRNSFDDLDDDNNEPETYPLDAIDDETKEDDSDEYAN